MSEPLHLYVHIPFCLKKCRYCSFVSRSDAPLAIDDYASLVAREMEMRVAAANPPP
ncbi:coproporphyrinogen III oxidase family protein, partial [Geobacter anodireducens]|nr:coproporphyrinogen III oxidase family protein [Geobacter anodireducens]